MLALRKRWPNYKPDLLVQVNRVVEHLKDISEHGVHLPANMIGLLPDQISELKLCEPDVQLTEPSQGTQVNV